jgi:prefoldin subunit 5
MSYEAMENYWRARVGPTNDQIKKKAQQLDGEIEWLTGRLANLSLSEEDFDQTQDYLFELRQERDSLKRCFNV